MTREHLCSLNELEGLETQRRVARHLQVQVDKPCASAYFDERIWPQVGERGNRFYALAAELKRLGLSEEHALDKMMDYFNRMPHELVTSPGQDGRPFTQKEVQSIITTLYKRQETKSYGCNSCFWDQTCIGQDTCPFWQQLSMGKKQKAETIFSFLRWLGAKDKTKKKVLKDSDVRVYLALIAIEKKRGFEPGSTLFTSWSEISKVAGITRQNVGNSLERLFWAGLVAYMKGVAQQRGTASEIRRVIPVPKPGSRK